MSTNQFQPKLAHFDRFWRSYGDFFGEMSSKLLASFASLPSACNFVGAILVSKPAMEVMFFDENPFGIPQNRQLASVYCFPQSYPANAKNLRCFVYCVKPRWFSNFQRH
jgi:hypothetical protein